MMAGQVKHAKIFSSIRPDWRLFKVLAALPEKNTDSLIGAVQKVLAEEGIELVDSTLLLKPLLAPSGAITKRKPDFGRAARYRVWAEDRPCAGEPRPGAERGDCRQAPAWRSKRWKGRTPCCGARRAWWKAGI